MVVQSGEDAAQGHTPVDAVGVSGVAVDVYATEEELLRAWGERVRKMDPDVLMGYEIQRSSWGYAVDRAAFAYRTRGAVA